MTIIYSSWARYAVHQKSPSVTYWQALAECGAGGSRTLVQTGKPYAFYTLILAFSFRVMARPRPPTITLSSKNSFVERGINKLFPIYLHRSTLRFGTTSLERCLVPSTIDGIKPVIYCTSIRQRERNCFRQLNCCLLRFRSQQTMLRVLTYHFIPLSNPVNPKMISLHQRDEREKVVVSRTKSTKLYNYFLWRAFKSLPLICKDTTFSWFCK